MKTLMSGAVLVLVFALALPAQTKGQEPKWEKTILKDNTYHAETYRYDDCRVHVRRDKTGLDLNAYDPIFRVGVYHHINVTHKNGKVDIQQHWAPAKQDMVLEREMYPDVFGQKCGSMLHLLPASVLRLFGGLYGYPKK